MNRCPSCDFPVGEGDHHRCRKCGELVSSRSDQGILEIDIAHAGESWEVARDKIERGLDQVFRYGHAGLKVIHGYGSTSGRSVIGPRTISYLRHVADEEGGRFARDRDNPGASIVWFNRD